ncbi:hypothetical protein, partial [Klebsiella pneumoniae]|uniref:hypothetical protein n=1 Tax=Klebsiella pneumoniae TaxID=573 RepID=UPI001CDAF64E
STFFSNRKADAECSRVLGGWGFLKRASIILAALPADMRRTRKNPKSSQRATPERVPGAARPVQK